MKEWLNKPDTDDLLKELQRTGNMTFHKLSIEIMKRIKELKEIISLLEGKK